MNTRWENFFGSGLVLFDGGMGTLLQREGLKGGERPETWNRLYPERIRQVHEAYLEAGARVVTTNTFGAARTHLGDDAPALMKAGVAIAKEAAANYGAKVAIDMGSLGRLPQPYGDLPFEEAVSQFRQAFDAGIQAGGDLILIETMTDLLETRAAVIAAKEALEGAGKDLPILVSLTFDEQGRLLSGADIQGTAAMLEGLGVTGIGLNCGREPKALMNNVQTLLAATCLPVFMQPNASLPVVVDGVTTFPTRPEEFAEDMQKIAAMGVHGVGGCCGTTPEHIRLVNEAIKGMERTVRTFPVDGLTGRTYGPCIISGRSGSLNLDKRPVIIGERLNPTGKKRMKQALIENDTDYMLREAIAQTDAGADVLDVNVGLPDIDEKTMLKNISTAVQTVCDCPLQLDTGDGEALEAAIRCYAGKPVINSVCGKETVMDTVFPIAAKYGGVIVCLCLDENGIPATVEGRMEVARRIIARAAEYGIPRSQLIFDALTMTVATDPQAANVTLGTIAALNRELHVKTMLGVSNVSFGLPQRSLLNSAFVAMAVREGLSAAILNPLDTLILTMFKSAVALSGKDEGFGDYLQAYGNQPALTLNTGTGAAAQAVSAKTDAAKETGDGLFLAIKRGVSGDAVTYVKARLEKGEDPLAVIDSSLMPALSEVGDSYEKGKTFLPQLLQSAGAAQAAFEVIRMALPPTEPDPARRIVLATVKGDVHDIGKNIVKVLLQNYGFTVIDLGKDVSPETVLQAVEQHRAAMVGLSALMTTTVGAMKDTIALVHEKAPGVKVIVGGAVLNPEYAASIQADGYGKDAMEAVRICQKWVEE
ncbi:MAG: homocysteine methyltransferase [Clostridiales bacterium]|nr:homocysteine methyltransferase [Clostridiales bacterium]